LPGPGLDDLEIVLLEVVDHAFGFLVDDLHIKDNQIGVYLDDVSGLSLLGATQIAGQERQQHRCRQQVTMAGLQHHAVLLPEKVVCFLTIAFASDTLIASCKHQSILAMLRNKDAAKAIFQRPLPS